MPRPRLSTRKKAAFLAFFCLVLLGAAELVGRGIERSRAARVTVANQFITATNVVRVFEPAVEDGRAVYVRTNHHWIPRWPRFAAEKEPGTIRVFCLGGSAALGWPHTGEQSYPAFLEEKLRRLYPGRPVEVLNVAGNTYASYRVKIVFDEVVQYDPDLIVIYSGNNEFLENVVYTPRAQAPGAGGAAEAGAPPGPLARSALARLLHRAATATPPDGRVVDVQNYSNRDQASNRLSFAFGRASLLRRDPAQLQTVEDHYRYNLESMAAEARRRGVPLLFCTVPINLKDWSPNVSSHRDGLGEEERRRYREALRAGHEALEARRPDDAVAPLERAAALDPEYALGWYLLGRAHREAGRHGEARRAYDRAHAQDGYPFRALFNGVLMETAAAADVPVADLVGALERETSDGTLGLDVLVDYVHPSVQSNEVIAQEVLEAAARAGLLPADPALAPEDARIAVPPEAGHELTAVRGLFGQFLIMRQYDGLDALASRIRAAIAARAPGASASERASDEKVLRRTERAMEVIRPYRRLLLAEQLGTLQGELSPAEAEAIFQDYVAFIRETEGRQVDRSEFETYVPARSYAPE